MYIGCKIRESLHIYPILLFYTLRQALTRVALEVDGVLAVHVQVPQRSPGKLLAAAHEGSRVAMVRGISASSSANGTMRRRMLLQLLVLLCGDGVGSVRAEHQGSAVARYHRLTAYMSGVDKDSSVSSLFIGGSSHELTPGVRIPYPGLRGGGNLRSVWGKQTGVRVRPHQHVPVEVRHDREQAQKVTFQEVEVA